MSTRVLWEWNVKAHLFAQQVEAAAAGAFDVLTVPYRKYAETTLGGLSARAMKRIARDAGVRLDFLDGMSSWAPIRYPEGADTFLSAALDYSADDALRVCDELGLTRIVAIAGFAPGAIELSELVDSFGSFSQRAASAGIWVDLEPMPMLGVPTLAAAWEIVEAVGSSNTGVMLDTWHFVRGGSDFELLGAIPPGKIANVQLADGYAEPVGATLWDDAMTARLLPGEGELPLVEILVALADAHPVASIGPEAITDELDRLSPAVLGQRAARGTDQVLAEASARARAQG